MKDSIIRRALSSGWTPEEAQQALRAEARAEELLRAARDLLTKIGDGPNEDALAETVHYDDTECDGHCLREDIDMWIDLYGRRP